MANGDPLRAQQIYDDLDEEWYQNWIAWQSAKSGKRKGEPIKPGTLDKIKKRLGWRGRSDNP